MQPGSGHKDVNDAERLSRDPRYIWHRPSVPGGVDRSPPAKELGITNITLDPIAPGVDCLTGN